MNLQSCKCVLLMIWLNCIINHLSLRVQAVESNPADFNPSVMEVNNLNQRRHNISIVGDQFILDGRTLQILSGSLHYFRLPANYWRDRLRKLKAAGLNAVSTYVEWSYHEPEERQYKFDGDRDIVQFVKTAAEEGLYVLLRPGPYICAERDLGGFPYWLLGKYPNIKLRTTDQNFIEETNVWMSKLFALLKPLLFGNGGPIILVQVENEYGSYGNDRDYMEKIRDILLQHVDTNALLYTTDGAPQSLFINGAVPRTLTTIDFGVGNNVTNSFKPLRRFMPEGPLMNSEYYPGWLTHWGETLQQVTTDQVIDTLRDMLDNQINLNFYMFFGGTNFEFSAGANYDGTYAADITSYDYDAPLSEAGDPTPKYYAIRNILAKYTSEVTNTPPPPSPKGAYGSVTVRPSLSLLSNKGRLDMGKTYNDITGSKLPTFEQLRQRAGLILYETKLNEIDGLLHIDKPRDRVYVYVDGAYQGILSRMHKIYSLPLITKPNSVLSLLVENQGRINFGSHLHDYKGILSTVKYNNKALEGTWSITGYPLEVLNSSTSDLLSSQSDHTQGPILYVGSFKLPAGQEPLDTFIDTTGWGKGYIWVNGYNLGRYWPEIGPQVTLYVPGVWLRAAPDENHLQILELEEVPSSVAVEFIAYPILNRTGRTNFSKYNNYRYK